MEGTVRTGPAALARTLATTAAWLLAIQAGRAASFWVLLRAFPPGSDVMRFQLLNGVAFAVTGVALIVLRRPAAALIGLDLRTVSRRGLVLYGAGLALVVAMIATGALLDPPGLVLNLVFGLVVPAFEETVFRGWVWSRLRAVAGEGLRADAVVIAGSAALFAVWHLAYVDAFLQHPSAMALMPLLLFKVALGAGLGLLLGLVRSRSRTVVPAFIVHALWNIMAP